MCFLCEAFSNYFLDKVVLFHDCYASYVVMRLLSQFQGTLIGRRQSFLFFRRKCKNKLIKVMTMIRKMLLTCMYQSALFYTSCCWEQEGATFIGEKKSAFIHLKVHLHFTGLPTYYWHFRKYIFSIWMKLECYAIFFTFQTEESVLCKVSKNWQRKVPCMASHTA